MNPDRRKGGGAVQAIYEFRSHREEDTEELAKQLSMYLHAGSVITLDGDLGAGKTRLSQGLARAIGVTEIVNSPTFTIVKEYEGKDFPLYHMDVYRITQMEADDLGLEEYYYGDGITLIEWASLIEPSLPVERLQIFIAYLGEQERLFRLAPYGEPYIGWCNKMKENGYLT